MIEVVATEKQFQSGRLQAVGNVFKVPEDKFAPEIMKRAKVKKGEADAKQEGSERSAGKAARVQGAVTATGGDGRKSARGKK